MNKDTPTLYKPAGDIVLIQVDEPARETASGIIIKEDWKTLPPTGRVVSVGPEVKDQTLPGKEVVFERYSSVVLGDDFRLCREANILAVKYAEVRG